MAADFYIRFHLSPNKEILLYFLDLALWAKYYLMLIDDLAQDGGHNFDFGKLLANNQLTATFKLARWAKEEALLSCKIYNTHAKDITTFDNSTLFYQSPETAFVLLLKQGRRTFVFQHATFYKELFK